MSPVATLMEIELLNKMSGLVGYKNGGGTFVPGGSSGNFLAMLAARHYCMNEVMSSGLFFWNWVIPVCAPPWIASDHSFYC